MKIHAQNEALVNKLTEILLVSLNEFETELRIAMDKKNVEDIVKHTHKFRGGLCYLSAPRLDYLCQHLEEALKSGDKTLIEALYPLVSSSIAQLRNILSH